MPLQRIGERMRYYIERNKALIYLDGRIKECINEGKNIDVSKLIYYMLPQFFVSEKILLHRIKEFARNEGYKYENNILFLSEGTKC